MFTFGFHVIIISSRKTHPVNKFVGNENWYVVSNVAIEAINVKRIDGIVGRRYELMDSEHIGLHIVTMRRLNRACDIPTRFFGRCNVLGDNHVANGLGELKSHDIIYMWRYHFLSWRTYTFSETPMYYDKKLYKLVGYRKSKTKYKKYDAILQGKEKKYIVPFGDKRYENYHDLTGLDLYPKLLHGDKKRRKLYRGRHQKDLKAGHYSPGYFSYYILW